MTTYVMQVVICAKLITFSMVCSISDTSAIERRLRTSLFWAKSIPSTKFVIASLTYVGIWEMMSRKRI